MSSIHVGGYQQATFDNSQPASEISFAVSSSDEQRAIDDIHASADADNERDFIAIGSF